MGFELTRRQALGLLGVAGAASLVRVARAACVDTVAQTQGPFWIDDRLARSDIRTDPSDGSTRPGVPLELRLNVSRADAGCAPAAGVQVDVWQCDAAGIYSDGDALRGYQMTDTAGTVRFTTIYPGWYPGRTIHIHYRVRAFDGDATVTDFVSQVYFDDAVSDQVLALAPYAGRGPRSRTNADDAIFDGALLLSLVADGSGGYTGTFDVGVSGIPAGGGSCNDLTACRAAVAAALPDLDGATTRKGAKRAARLARLFDRASVAIDRATEAMGKRQRRQYRKARAALEKLLAVATAVNAGGTLAPLVDAVTALLARIPSA